MSALYRRIGEGIGGRTPPAKDAFQADPRALKAWIAALPLANAGATARLLYQALRELNNIRIDPMVRLNSLEALRHPIGQIADWVDRQIIGSSFPLPPQKQQLGTIARDFQHELAMGYRTVVHELCAPEGKVPFLKGKAVALALERAISHLGALLSKAYLLYATAPAGAWRTMHDLHRFAQELGLDDKAVEDPLLGGAELSPGMSYRHALLMAISNPYRLTQKEIHETHLLTRVWASQVRAAGAENPRAFSVPVDEDAGPGYLPEERRTGGGTARYDTASLEHELDRQLTLSAGIGGALSFRLKSAAAVAVSPDLVRRLVQSWQPQAARTHTRLPAGHELETLLGLHAIHYHLAGAVDFETFVRRTCGAVHFQERERAASWTAQGGDGSKPESFRATVLDQGLGGYRVEWDKVESVRARVGEIVAMTLPIEEGDEADWMVGIIRWLRIDPQGKVDAGIELLTRHARAAVLRAVDTAGHPKPPVRALRLNPVRATAPQDPPYSVVVPSVVERGAPKYELITVPERYADDDEAEVDVIASVAVLDSSGTYVRLAPRQDPVAAERDPLVANG